MGAQPRPARRIHRALRRRDRHHADRGRAGPCRGRRVAGAPLDAGRLAVAALPAAAVALVARRGQPLEVHRQPAPFAVAASVAGVADGHDGGPRAVTLASAGPGVRGLLRRTTAGGVGRSGTHPIRGGQGALLPSGRGRSGARMRSRSVAFGHAAATCGRRRRRDRAGPVADDDQPPPPAAMDDGRERAGGRTGGLLVGRASAPAGTAGRAAADRCAGVDRHAPPGAGDRAVPALGGGAGVELVGESPGASTGVSHRARAGSSVPGRAGA